MMAKYTTPSGPSTSPHIETTNGNVQSASVAGARKPVYPHIKDLQTVAMQRVREIGPYVPIRTLLDKAEESAQRVKTDIAFKRQDEAYVEHLISSELLVNVVPKHKDYTSLISDRGERNRRYQLLCQNNTNQSGTIAHIRDLIDQDNAQSGVHASHPPGTDAHPRPSPQSRDLDQHQLSTPVRPLSSPHNDELFLENTAAIRTLSPPNSHTQPAHRSHVERPAISPKPPRLQSHKIPQSHPDTTTHDDALANRFSRMRVQQRASSATSVTTSHDHNHHGMSPNGSIVSSTLPRPLGPRAMPVSRGAMSQTARTPVDAHPPQQQWPEPPQPAYDPAKSGLPILNTASASRRSSTIASSPHTPRSQSPIHGPSAAIPVNLPPRKYTITAAELLEISKGHSVLLIDVRSREQFDAGHILGKCIICVEPVGIRAGMSAEELDERLVNSPGAEQALFERIDEFEAVVYYDARTANDNFLKGPPTQTSANHLRAVHDTLYEFNDFRRLRRAPMLLLGGLEAWVDLLGPQSLATSKTAIVVKSTGPGNFGGPHRRTLSRVPTMSANSPLEIRRRRIQDMKPLTEDEERKWREKTQNEEVQSKEYLTGKDGEDTNDLGGEEQDSPFVRTYEDFLRRYPEPNSVQQSMVSPVPQARQVYTQPAAPKISASVSTVPSRPLPARSRPSYGGVSERASSSAVIPTRQTSASLQPIYTARTISHSRGLPRTGLVNFGVTCYMNATIQSLLATMPLSQLFLGESWRELTRKNWKGSNGVLPGIFANLIRNLWKDEAGAVRPVSLRSFCARLKEEWGVDRQQDAKEFFDFLIDCMHEDLNVNFNRTPLDPLTAKDEAVRERMSVRKAAQIEWDRYSHREKSLISDFFAGQHASRLRCTTCQHTSTTYEAFYSISVEIPRQNPKRGMWDVQSCLRSYCQEEKLSGDEVWKCPYCRKEREATKQIILTRAPSFLVLHFKRFEMRRGDTKKVHTPINFPLYGLDLGSYMAPDDGPADSNDSKDHATTGPYVYDAYAVVRHIGSTGNGGHYIALVRDAARNCWRKFDDDRVEDFDPSKLKGDRALQNEQAYLVFYGRASPR